MAGTLKKIVIIGPESTGKSDLSEGLAKHFNTLYVPEFAREYLITNGSAYTKDDLTAIANGQLVAEDRIAALCIKQRKDLLFIDTDLHVLKTWSEFVFNSCDLTILDEIPSRRYDMFLLTNTDLPWVQDTLREYPDLETRRMLFHHYRDALINQHVPWVEISGTGPERIRNAVEAVDRMCRGWI